MHRRVLNAGEAAILAMIQQGYGPQNTVDAVFFTNADEAVISVKASDGTSPLMANLSNLAAWRHNLEHGRREHDTVAQLETTSGGGGYSSARHSTSRGDEHQPILCD